VTGRQTLTVAQLYALARRAGLPPDRAAVAAAVAMAESSGRSWVTSPNPDGGTNVGPWQLDTPGGKGAGYTVEELQDPWTNAKVMAQGTNGGQDWSAWQTYAEGTYRQFMPGAQKVAGDEPAASQSSGSGGSWIDHVLHGLEGPFKALEEGGSSAASAAGGLIKLPKGVTSFFDSADKVAQGFVWFLNPANWARVMSGVLGFVLLAAGLFYLAKAA